VCVLSWDSGAPRGEEKNPAGTPTRQSEGKCHCAQSGNETIVKTRHLVWSVDPWGHNTEYIL
jgi:hypothetical protein